MSGRQYLDQNEEDVAGILAAYDTLVARTEAYLERLNAQQAEVQAAGDAKSARMVDIGQTHARGLLALLESEVLDLVIGLKNNTHNIRTARAGKLV